MRSRDASHRCTREATRNGEIRKKRPGRNAGISITVFCGESHSRHKGGTNCGTEPQSAPQPRPGHRAPFRDFLYRPDRHEIRGVASNTHAVARVTIIAALNQLAVVCTQPNRTSLIETCETSLR